MTNGVLLLGRLLMAACFLPAAVARLANISGFALQLWLKGIPYSTAVAAVIGIAEVFGPLALVLGLAPRLTAGALMAATMVTLGTLHRFWELSGAARQAEQAIFLAHLGLLAGLLFYAVSGPGAWSWQALWRRGAGRAKPARKAPARAKSPKPRPLPPREEVPSAA